MTPLLWAVAVHALGALADWYTTKRGVVDRKGLFREVNPVGRFFLRWGEWGIGAMVLLPLAFLTLLNGPAVVHYCMGGAHALAALWNWRLIRKAR